MPKSAAIQSYSDLGVFSPEAALDTLNDAIIIIDQGNAVLYANSSAEHLFSFSRTSFIRYGLPPILGTEHPLLGLISRVIESGHAVVERDVTFQRPGFEKFAVDVRVARVGNTDTQVLLTFMVESNALRHDESDDDHGHRQLAGMAAVLAHEVKNPLSGIRGAAQLMERYLPEDSKELSRLITRECDRITAMVDEMDSFGNEKPATLEVVNIHEALDHVITLASSSTGHKIMFERLYDPSLPPVSGNADRLVQVFLNIIKNAIEATQAIPSANITIKTAYRHGVRVERPNGSPGASTPIEITITDNGTGVSADVKSLLFEPFVTTKAGGRGLGLPLVARYLADMGGTIEHFSSDAGTHFRIHLVEDRHLAQERRDT